MRHVPLPKRRFRREKPRLLALLYDVIGFIGIFAILFFVYYPSAFEQQPGLSVIAAHFAASFVPIFFIRIFFRNYNRVLRYGNPGIYAQQLRSDLIGGAIYIGICFLLPEGSAFRIPIIVSALLVLATLVVSLLARLMYHYLYQAGGKDTPVGHIIGSLLRFFEWVDARSQQEADVLTVDEWLGKIASAQAGPINEIQRVARQFQIVGEITDIKQINKGYINRTYRVRTLSVHGNVHSYTLQRINTNVFPDADALMANFELITNHLHETFLLPSHTERGSVQMLRRTKDDKPYFRDDSGCWRMLTHFTDVYSMDIPDSPETFYYAGLSFGMFVRCMADVPVEEIKIVIPNFHNTYSRYLDLEAAVEADPVHRLKDVWDEVEFIRARKGKFRIISDALESGRIPTRICHNDCNLNNILFSEESKLPVAIIDLDTVMPGTPLYDYGDSMRIGTNTARDDEKDLKKVSCDLNLYEQYARGYLKSCGDMLTREELELLPFASLIITAEDGIRFLADHINGDIYYNVFYPNQNLDRSRTQLKLLADMEKKEMGIRRTLETIYQELGLQADPYRIPF